MSLVRCLEVVHVTVRVMQLTFMEGRIPLFRLVTSSMRVCT